MLVLSRKKNESIVINNDITVTVVEIRGDKVRLGIVAPKDVPVHRQEVYEAIHGREPSETPPTVVVTKPSEAPARPAKGGDGLRVEASRWRADSLCQSAG